MAFDFTSYKQNLANSNEPFAGYDGNGTGNSDFHFDNPRAAILTKKQNTVVRILGLPPKVEALTNGTTKPGPYDAHEYLQVDCYNSATLNAAKPKKCKLIFPMAQGKDAHPVIQMARNVLKTQKLNGADVAVYAAQFPELYLYAQFGGGSGDKNDASRFYYSMKPSGKTLFNVIDRSDDWCKTNKHSKLIASSGTNKEDGTQAFVDYGVSVYSFSQAIEKTLSKYGLYDGYDVAIYPTGKTSPAMEIVNVSHKKEKDDLDEVEGVSGDNVVIGPLTAEEQAYELYDIEKAIHYSDDEKIFKCCERFIKLYDDAFGTSYYSELKEKADACAALKKAKKAEKEAAKQAEQNTAITASVQVAEQEEAAQVAAAAQAVEEEDVEPRTSSRQAVEEAITKRACEKLAHPEVLNEEEKAAIVTVDMTSQPVPTATFSTDPKWLKRSKCDCGFIAPRAFKACPNCGVIYEQD